MNTSPADSALNVAAWFNQRAKEEGLYLEHERLQHLLFLTQVHYALVNNGKLFMPSLFVCSRDGFFEPAVASMAGYGCRDFPEPHFDKESGKFLEAIWKKYASLTLRDLGDLVKNHTSYEQHYISGKNNIVLPAEMIKNFKISMCLENNRPIIAKEKRKILLSQNGPVVVSKWNPRKL